MQLLNVPAYRSIWMLLYLCGASLLLTFSNPLRGQYFIEQAFHFTDRDGLPSMEIYDLLQDQKGYLWLGTEAGLVFGRAGDLF